MDFVMKQALGGATKDMGKMLGGEEEKDPDAQKKEEERQEALRQQEEERKAKHARMEAEREKVRQQIRDKYGLKKKEEKEAEEKAALEQPCEGSLTRPKKAIPAGCGDEEEVTRPAATLDSGGLIPRFRSPAVRPMPSVNNEEEN